VSRLGKDEEVEGGVCLRLTETEAARFCVLPFRLGILEGTNDALA
jgi:hypothetical protein